MANSEEKNLTPSENSTSEKEHSSSHGEHSHSGGHHHQHHRYRRPLSRRIRRWLDKKFGKHSTSVLNLFSLFIALLIIASMILVGITAQNRYSSRSESTETETDTSPIFGETQGIEMELPYFDKEVVIISEAAEIYLASPSHGSINDIVERYRRTVRLDIGSPVSLRFDFPSLPDELAEKSVIVQVAETADFASYRQWTAGTRQQNVKVYNLKTDTTYYYRIGFEGTSQFVQGSFTTADTRRFMNVAGAVNVRDIGGIKVAGGKAIKQGLLYRGSELDGAIESEYLLEYEGLDTMLNIMGIKTEMDLRSSTDNAFTSEPLGKSVAHKYYNAPYYEQIFTEDGKNTIRAIFADLAKEENYPIYLHCTYGLDRTGIVCYLLEALLGADELDVIRDYKLSALYHGYVSGDLLEPMIAGLRAYEGNTLSEKVENYLLSAGITEKEIASIRAIFLES